MIRLRTVLGLSLLTLLLVSSVTFALTIGIVQRWHGTIEADNVLAQHFIGGGQAAVGTPVSGAGCGATVSNKVATGSDVSGQVGITCGATGGYQGTILTESFTHAYQHAADCHITPANRATAQLAAVNVPFVSTSGTTAFTIVAGSAALPSGTYLWNYICTDRLP